MPSSLRNVAIYNAMIDGLFKAGEIYRAKELFDEMPSSLRNVVSYTAMIDGLCKAGEIDLARELFDELTDSSCEKNVTLWNAMLMGLAIHGDGVSVLQYLSRMLEDGVKPDGVIFLSVLVGCWNSFCGQKHKSSFSAGISLSNSLSNSRSVIESVLDLYWCILIPFCYTVDLDMMMKEKFAELLLGEDMSGGGKGVSYKLSSFCIW